MAEHLRRVIREHRFEEELRALIGDVISADEFVEGAEWLLARDLLSACKSNRTLLFGFCPWLRSEAHKFPYIILSMNQLFGCFQLRECDLWSELSNLVQIFADCAWISFADNTEFRSHGAMRRLFADL